MEVIDYHMAAEGDLPQETDIDKFWVSMHETKLVGSVIQHTLPASNADSEQTFSMIRIKLNIDVIALTTIHRKTSCK